MNKQDMRVLDQVLRTVSRYNMLAAGTRAGVAVSGGADSLALLHILVRLGGPRRWSLEVLHFDHGLRGEESDGDRRFVEELADKLGLPCHVEGADVRAAAAGANLEQTARQMRYRFFKEVRERRGLDAVATGHTASDQAETVLMRVLRGAAAESLAGIRPVNDGWIVRPLIEVTREDVREWLRSQGLVWREDSSNIDSCYDRNRMRTNCCRCCGGSGTRRLRRRWRGWRRRSRGTRNSGRRRSRRCGRRRRRGTDSELS